MKATRPPKDDRAGGDYTRGVNPDPGGEIDIGTSEVPPYDGRTVGGGKPATGTARAFGSESPLENPESPASPEVPDKHSATDQAPEGVGESTARRGEDVIREEGEEPGRTHTGTDDSLAQRPTGESNPRDETSVKPAEDT
ncbi:hypothetical protein [Arthrobacter sp. ISL-69]|uniref:hypothetical protein n=1 Tax=Arthrobacter sp. ISL-69 TaxID=2819113 RepID=UPI001BEAB7F4|nr:hypothetical protein [Arthrobacter sp. ISL-69]MBT2538863.1 hypothetical protein [Arthrobacter sp. ISL-69]